MNTVSHSESQAPHFLTKMLESNILYDNLLMTFYLFNDIEKISESLIESFCYVKGNFDKKCMCNLNVYIFLLCFVLGIIDGDLCDRKTPKTIILFNKNPMFWSLNLITPLLFEEMLVLTSY